MIGPASVEHNPRLYRNRREDAAVLLLTVASFYFVGGLSVGSLISFGVSVVLCQCNPYSARNALCSGDRVALEPNL